MGRISHLRVCIGEKTKDVNRMVKQGAKWRFSPQDFRSAEEGPQHKPPIEKTKDFPHKNLVCSAQVAKEDSDTGN
jgi:hypothetical protein